MTGRRWSGSEGTSLSTGIGPGRDPLLGYGAELRLGSATCHEPDDYDNYRDNQDNVNQTSGDME
jgi:hypothetical protein